MPLPSDEVERDRAAAATEMDDPFEGRHEWRESRRRRRQRACLAPRLRVRGSLRHMFIDRSRESQRASGSRAARRRGTSAGRDRKGGKGKERHRRRHTHAHTKIVGPFPRDTWHRPASVNHAREVSGSVCSFGDERPWIPRPREPRRLRRTWCTATRRIWELRARGRSAQHPSNPKGSCSSAALSRAPRRLPRPPPPRVQLRECASSAKTTATRRTRHYSPTFPVAISDRSRPCGISVGHE